MCTMKPLIARMKAWDAFISHGLSLRRLHVWAPRPARLLCEASSKPSSFDNSEPKRQKQAYFKGKAAEANQNIRAKPSASGPRKSGAAAPSSELQRLAKVMAAAGVASRRACEDLIEKGVVKVNGKVVDQQGTMVNPEKDLVTVDGKKVSVLQPKLYYFMVNKPKGYICSNTETKEGKGKRVVDILQPWLNEWQKKQDKKALPPRLFTVGRLDVASHGLILVTNDGHWAQKVIHPSSDLTKEYVVLVDKKPGRSHLETIMAGAEVDGVHVAPQEASILKDSCKIKVVVAEGKKHEHMVSSTLEGSSGHGGAAGSSKGGSSAPGSSEGGSSNPDSGASSGRVAGCSGDDSSSREGSSTKAGQLPSTAGTQSVPVAVEAPAHTQPSTATLDPATRRIPRISSSLFVVKDPDGSGQEMWMWNVAPWRRLRAQAQLQADAAATAPPAYMDGRPKRRPKELRVDQKGFAHPDSFPTVFRAEEWRAMGEEGEEKEGPDTWGKEGEGEEEGPDTWEKEEEQAGFAAVSHDSLSQVQLDPRNTVLAMPEGEDWLYDIPSLGLLDPSLFDSQGRMLEGGDLQAAQAALEREEQQRRQEAQRQRQQAQQQLQWRQRCAAASSRIPDLVCRDAWDWKVRILVAAAGLEVLSLKRVRVGGLRVPPSLGLGGYRQMTAREVKSVTDISQQEQLRRNSWESASILLVKEKSDDSSSGSSSKDRR